jgi:ABC-type Fe3+-siderophore transport system permease subunit
LRRQETQIERIVLVVICLFVAGITLRRGMTLWHRDRRMPKNLVTGVFFSRAFHYGIERAMLPMAAFGVFLAAAILISVSAGSKNSHLTGARWWLGVIAVSGITVSVALTLAIVYFNRPRWMVPPFMRSEQGITAAWWSRRHGRGGHGESGQVRSEQRRSGIQQ